MSFGDRRGHEALSSAVAARWQGTTTDFILQEIQAGLLVASRSPRPAAQYVIYFDDYVAYLRHVRWSRIPATPEELFRVAGRRLEDHLAGLTGPAQPREPREPPEP